MSHKGAWTLAMVLLAAPVAAQDWKGMGRLEGRVLDPDGKPIEGATVKLDLPERGGGPAPLTTDKKGKWAVGGVVAASGTPTSTPPASRSSRSTSTCPASPRASLPSK
jgi:hypothetical protein